MAEEEKKPGIVMTNVEAPKKSHEVERGGVGAGAQTQGQDNQETTPRLERTGKPVQQPTGVWSSAAPVVDHDEVQRQAHQLHLNLQRRNPGKSSLNPEGYGFSGSTLPELEEYLRERMEANKPESDEERRKRERREKWEGVISGIADMGMALGNLYFTTQGAPNSYDGTSGLSAKAKERFEQAKAERERNEDRYYNYAMQIGKLRSDKHKDAYNERVLSLREAEEERRRLRVALEDRKQEWLEKYQQGRLDIDAERNRIEDEYKRGLITIQERNAASRELSAQAAYLRAQTAGSRSSGSGSGSGGGRSGGKRGANERAGEYMYNDPDGWEDAMEEALGHRNPYANLKAGEVERVVGAYEARRKRQQSGGQSGGKAPAAPASGGGSKSSSGGSGSTPPRYSNVNALGIGKK